MSDGKSTVAPWIPATTRLQMNPITNASTTNRTSAAPRASIFAKKAVSLSGRWERTVFKVPQPYSLPTTSAPRIRASVPPVPEMFEST